MIECALILYFGITFGSNKIKLLLTLEFEQMKNLFLLVALLIAGTTSYAQSLVGKWSTIDDVTGKLKSTVELYKQGDHLYGKVTHLYPREDREPNPKCTKCTDDRKNQPILGLQILRGLKYNGSEWEGGTIVDPENGKIYKCKIWIDPSNPDVLNVRGYVGPFHRTQTWKRAK